MASTSNMRCKNHQHHHRHPIFDTYHQHCYRHHRWSRCHCHCRCRCHHQKNSRCNQFSVFRALAFCSVPYGNLKLCLLLAWVCAWVLFRRLAATFFGLCTMLYLPLCTTHIYCPILVLDVIYCEYNYIFKCI